MWICDSGRMNSSVFLSFPGISSGVPEVFFFFFWQFWQLIVWRQAGWSDDKKHWCCLEALQGLWVLKVFTKTYSLELKEECFDMLRWRLKLKHVNEDLWHLVTVMWTWLAITLRLLDGRTIYSIFCTQMAKGLKSSTSIADVSLAAGEPWLRSIWLSGVGNSWRIWCVDGNWDAVKCCNFSARVSFWKPFDPYWSAIFSVYFGAGGCRFLEGPLATCLHWGLEYWIGWCFLGVFQ